MNRFALAFLLSTTCLYLGPILPTPALFFPVLVATVWCVKNHFYIVAGLFGGVALLCIHSYSFVNQSLPAVLVGVDSQVIGRITGIPRHNASVIQFDFALDELNTNHEFTSTPRNLRLSCYRCTLDLRAGQTWQLTVKLKPGRGMLNPGGFDYEKWLRGKRIDAVGYVRLKAENNLINASTGFLGLRGELARQLEVLPLSKGAKALARSLALGDGATLGKPFWDVLRKTGTSHLMVISGLHISLIAASVSGFFALIWKPLTRWRRFRVSRTRFSYTMGVVAAIMYAALAGFTVPTIRALIMLVSYLLFLWTRRHMGSMKPLAISLVVVLLFQPYSPLLPGFWMSFFAVAFIHFYLTTRIVNGQWFIAYLHWHFALTVGMAPITLLFFGYISPVSMLANFFAVPLVSVLVVPLVLVGASLLFAIESPGVFVLELANRIMSLLMQGLSLLADFEVSQLWLGGSTIWLCLALLLGVVIWLLPIGIRYHWLSLPLVSAVFLTDTNRLADHEFEVKIIDVGQGLSVLVRTKNHNLLFDTGGRLGSGTTIADAVVLPMLRFEGVDTLDKLIVSHPDSDHSAGVESITDAIPVASVVTEGSFASEIKADEYCENDQFWMWDGVRFEFMNDSSIDFSSENNRSCVLLVSSGSSEVVLPGDIEIESEQHLISVSPKRQVDLIVSPHHGSRTSSSQTFVEHMKPQFVVHSVGWRNRYKFPHVEIIARYNQQGAETYRTDRDGMLTFVFAEDGIKGEPIAYRDAHCEFWRSDFDLRLQ